jgi:hypothetical protein
VPPVRCTGALVLCAERCTGCVGRAVGSVDVEVFSFGVAGAVALLGAVVPPLRGVGRVVGSVDVGVFSFCVNGVAALLR